MPNRKLSKLNSLVTMLLRQVGRVSGVLRPFSASAVIMGQSCEKPFPVMAAPMQITDNAALTRSSEAEKSYLKILFMCQSGGGEKAIHKHVVLNKKVLVRERIRRILDDDSEFFEICPTAGLGLDYGDVPGAATVAGIGMIRGRMVLLLASDGSMKGGTSYPITVTKSLRAQEVAMENRIPCLYVVDSGGAFLPLQADIFPDVKHGGRTFRNQAVMSGCGIPQVAIVAGPCTAGGAYTPTMSDEAIMVNRIGHVFLGGPPLVKAATGEVVSQEDLGGAKLHTTVSGVADYFAKDEEESFCQVRDIISGLNEPAPKELNPLDNPPLFPASELDYYGGLQTITKKDVSAVIARIVDYSRFAEFKANFGSNLITGYAKICDQLVGLCANAGCLTSSDGQKGAHFLQLCDGRDIPVIFIQNNGSGAHDVRFDSIKDSAKFAHVSANLGVPKISINIGGLSGPQDMVAMSGPSFGSRFLMSWPRARFSKSGLFAQRENVSWDDTDFPEDSALYAASRCTIDGIVLPRETRTALAKALQIVMHKHQGQGRSAQQNSVVRI